MNIFPDAIDRREALRRAAVLLGGAISAPTLAGVLAGCERPARTAAGWKPTTLTEAQAEMVATIGEHILPETDTPGARAARVQEFIDVMLSDYYPKEERDRFVTGLQRAEARGQRAFGKPFLELSSDQQLQLVKALNRQAFNDPAARQTSPSQEPVLQETEVETGRSDEDDTRPASGAVMLDEKWDPEDVGREAFFRILKELVVVGYYTSEVGATQELRMNPMGSWRGDVPYSNSSQAWAS